MSIQASRSSYRGQSKGDAQIKEGRFVVDYRMADHRLYYRQADNA